MEPKLNRRQVIGGTAATLATATLPAVANSKEKPLTPRLTALLDQMQSALEGVQVMEVTGNIHSPHYRMGDLIFVQAARAKANDHVLLKLKSNELVFGAFVHNDGKTAYVRGFKAGDRINGIPFASVKEWGRIVISYRA